MHAPVTLTPGDHHVAIADIVLDAGTQVRTALRPDLVQTYADALAAGVPFPRIVVFEDPTNGRLVLADGFHRLAAWRRLDAATVDARVVVGSVADALWYAIGANRAHGARLTPGDKRHAIVAALRTWPDMSAARIADQVGCSAMYVVTVRTGVADELNLPDRIVSRTGVSYPRTTEERDRVRALAVVRLREGWTYGQIRKELKIGKDAIAELRKSLDLADVRTQPAAAAERITRIRTLAANGYSTRQIAEAIQVGEHWTRKLLDREAIAVPADRVIGRTKRHDPNRIVAQMAIDAENITADVHLIDFDALDAARLASWITSFAHSRRALTRFINRLSQEKTRHDTPTHAAPVEDPPGSDR